MAKTIPRTQRANLDGFDLAECPDFNGRERITGHGTDTIIIDGVEACMVGDLPVMP